MIRNREFSALIIITCILLFIGLTMAYSAGAPVGEKKMEDDHYYFKRMLAFAFIGAVCLCLTAIIHYDTWIKHWQFFYGVSAICLILVFTPLGVSAGGARRSLNIGITTIQPSEFARLTIMFFLASFCVQRGQQLRNLKKGYIPALIGISGLTVFILAGRDLGIPVTIGLTSLLILFIAGARIVHLGATAGLALLAFTALTLSETYRIKRMIAFMDPWRELHYGGWQIIQSMAAFGSGGPYGVGLGKGLQKYLYLPAAHTDFVFSIIGEELGLMGTIIVNLAFAALAVVGIRIALKARNYQASLLAIGMSFIIATTALINMAVAVHLMPTKGITLPLISYGGSSLITNLIAIGILMNIARVSAEPETVPFMQTSGAGATTMIRGAA